MGGIVFTVCYFLPWRYAYNPPDCFVPYCPPPETRAPVDGVVNMFNPLGRIESWFFLAVLIAVAMGIPLAVSALGVRLIAPQQPVWLRWKLLVILAGFVGLGAAFVLSIVMDVRYIDEGPGLVRTEIGQNLAVLAALAVLAGGMVMPWTRRQAS